jgi:membrane fusion protein (multidrug efflux system)
MEKKQTNKKFIIIIGILLLTELHTGLINTFTFLTREQMMQIEKNMNPIIPRVAGYVSKVYIKDNDFVKKGDTLFTIDNNDYELKLMKQQQLLQQPKVILKFQKQIREVF